MFSKSSKGRYLLNHVLLCKLSGILFALVAWLPSVAQVDSDERDVAYYMSQAYHFQRSGDMEWMLISLDSANFQALSRSDKAGLAEVNSFKGILYQIRGDYNQALKFQLDALALAEELDSIPLIANILNCLGSINQYREYYDEALNYYEQSLELRKEIGNQRAMAESYNNFGALYEDMGKLDSALIQHNYSLEIWKNLKDTSWLAITYTNIGSCLEIKGELDSALTLYQRSLDLFDLGRAGHQKGMVMRKIGAVHLLKKEPYEALKWCRNSLSEAKYWNVIRLGEQSCYCLYQAYQQLGDTRKTLELYQEYISFRDSLSDEDQTRKFTKLEMDYEFKKKLFADSVETAESRLKTQFEFQNQLTKIRGRRNLYMAMGIGVFLLAIGLWSRLNYIRNTTKVIQQEKDRSDQLLLNILPAPVAHELKTTGTASARNYENVSVLFTDFIDFSGLSKRLSANELVDELDTYFIAFDKIIHDFGLEKIKTIGDSYMAVGGLHDRDDELTIRVADAALTLQEFIETRKIQQSALGKNAFEMRVGIHSGPVVAGVVGQSKFQYDIWGETVNIASRMEQHGMSGKVNVSSTTYNLIEHSPKFECHAREPIEVKGKGEMTMYFVSRKST